LEYHDQVANFGPRQIAFVSQQIERRAEWSYDRCNLALTALHFVADDDWVVLANHLTEVA
jgi:hypothetical protein